MLNFINRINDFNTVLQNTVLTNQNQDVLELQSGFEQIVQKLAEIQKNKGSLYVIGNGGSAGVASHAVTDFLNVGKMKAFTLHDCSLITCMSNDYGYENAFAEILKRLASPNDMLIAISSSGNSKNMINAINYFNSVGGTTLTLSGFNPTNALRQVGQSNLWLDTNDYGFAEIGHALLLHFIADNLKTLI